MAYPTSVQREGLVFVGNRNLPDRLIDCKPVAAWIHSRAQIQGMPLMLQAQGISLGLADTRKSVP